jgi:hypothetical protein
MTHANFVLLVLFALIIFQRSDHTALKSGV